VHERDRYRTARAVSVLQDGRREPESISKPHVIREFLKCHCLASNLILPGCNKYLSPEIRIAIVREVGFLSTILNVKKYILYR
jgi:hypothetical protein